MRTEGVTCTIRIARNFSLQWRVFFALKGKAATIARLVEPNHGGSQTSSTRTAACRESDRAAPALFPRLSSHRATSRRGHRQSDIDSIRVARSVINKPQIDDIGSKLGVDDPLQRSRNVVVHLTASLAHFAGAAGASSSCGAGLKWLSLPGAPSHSFASAGGMSFTVMFGHLAEYSRLSFAHSSSAGAVSGLIASAGHSGSHTPQSMHSSG